MYVDATGTEIKYDSLGYREKWLKLLMIMFVWLFICLCSDCWFTVDDQDVDECYGYPSIGLFLLGFPLE